MTTRSHESWSCLFLLRSALGTAMISELERVVEIGLFLFVPFLIIVFASVLMSMGTVMLPPVVLSLPFKLIFFRSGGLLESWLPAR